MGKTAYQKVFIGIDDSGVLVPNERFFVYAGVVFVGKDEYDEFSTRYKAIVDSVKCSYCSSENSNCDKSCPEIKHSMLRPKDRRRMLNYIKRHRTLGCVVENGRVYGNTMRNKGSRRRYADYILRLTVKEALKKLISSGDVLADKPLMIVLQIDEQSTKSNGYYSLKDGMLEEFGHGISNFDYGTIFPPIVSGDLSIQLNYKDSKTSSIIQASDLVAGALRRDMLGGTRRIRRDMGCIRMFP